MGNQVAESFANDSLEMKSQQSQQKTRKDFNIKLLRESCNEGS